MKNLLLLVMTFSLVSLAEADSPVPVTVIEAGDIEAMNSVIDLVNALPSAQQIDIVNSSSGNTVTEGSLRGVTGGTLILNGRCRPRCSFVPDPNIVDLQQLVVLSGPSSVVIKRVEIMNYTGGALELRDQSELRISNSVLRDNSTPMSGAAITTADQAYVESSYNVYDGNRSMLPGDHVQVSAVPSRYPAAFVTQGDQYYSDGGMIGWENPLGNIDAFSITYVDEGGINSTGQVQMFNTLFDRGIIFFKQADGKAPPQKLALCNDFGTGAFDSQGFNIASDNSCDLDQATDLPGTDPMVTLNEDGFLMPSPESPAIDSGTFGLILVDGGPLASLPCGYRDLAGTARPQDGDGNGVFECDRGAIEVTGAGEVVAGHSSVFYNPERNGEGNYVEILEDGQAIVYTFSYNPEGTGPAWFLGVGEVNGNSIVLDDLLHPNGTSFGDDFDTTEIDFTEAGSMSMVFPDCQASAPGGSVAFTGDEDLGYEALLTRSTRLAHITGCGTETPVPNAGLSGSFFDPARNGEGLIVEWLTNGDVLVVFFTYDTEGNQLWLFGQAPSNGKAVTLTALYPTAFTPWGRGFDADDVSLESWGTFTLTWTDCNSMTFEYNSTVEGYGSGTRNYTRLSTLAGVTCPAFP
jgi:hypothetical protein